jgi:hypothetical protein
MLQIDPTSQQQSSTDIRNWNNSATHPLQSWEWGEFRKAMGIDVVRTKHGQLTFHNVPHTPWVIGYFPKGPKPTSQMLHDLRLLGASKHAIFIQLEPNIAASKNTLTLPELRASHHPLFTKYTFVLDLNKSEEELLKAMHSKTRYNLRIAQKHGVSVTEDNSEKAFAAYLRLNEETTGRQGFFAHNKTYHQTMWRIMKDAGIAHLFTATYKGEILAAWILFAWNKTLYYPYGTSSRQHREVMAPTLLLWEIAKWGKANGYTSFDLWGAMGPEPDPDDPWFGFHRFKQGFNPLLVEHVGSFDLVINPLLYKLYTLADTIRWFLLKRGLKS